MNKIHIPDSVLAYIKATTAFGGDYYPEYEQGYTGHNERQFTLWINDQSGVEGATLYRGYSFNETYWEDGMVEEGSVIGVDQMTQSIDIPSFTKSLIRAVNYMNEFGEVGLESRVKTLFEIETTGRYFVNISPWSIYPKEGEYRCKEATKLLVTEVKQKGGYLHVKCKEV